MKKQRLTKNLLKISILSFSLGLSSIALAGNVNQALLQDEAANVERTELATIKCVRNLIDTQGQGPQTILTADRILSALKAAATPVRKEAVSKYCKALPIKSTTKLSKLEMIEAAKATRNNLIMSFVSPAYECTSRALGASVLLGAGVGADVSAGICTGSNGKRWLTFVPKLGAGLGFFGSVHFTKSQERFAASDEFAKILSLPATEERTSFIMGFGGIEGQSTDQRTQVQGGGAGFNVSHVNYKGLRIKLLPVPGSDEVLLNQFKLDSQDGSAIAGNIAGTALRADQGAK